VRAGKRENKAASSAPLSEMVVFDGCHPRTGVALQR